jgi:uncharacterized membrane protein
MSWQLFAIGSAFFAGLTVIFGKLRVEGLNFNLATLTRTVIMFCNDCPQCYVSLRVATALCV